MASEDVKQSVRSLARPYFVAASLRAACARSATEDAVLAFPAGDDYWIFRYANSEIYIGGGDGDLTGEFRRAIETVEAGGGDVNQEILKRMILLSTGLLPPDDEEFIQPLAGLMLLIGLRLDLESAVLIAASGAALACAYRAGRVRGSVYSESAELAFAEADRHELTPVTVTEM